MTDYTIDVFRLFSFLLSAIAAGCASVVWWIIKGLSTDIKQMNKELIINTQTCNDKFRTKKEAYDQWTQLNLTMEKAEVIAQERFSQIWKKIDNQTALFMQEKGLLNSSINGLSDKITRNEIAIERIKENHD